MPFRPRGKPFTRGGGRGNYGSNHWSEPRGGGGGGSRGYRGGGGGRGGGRHHHHQHHHHGKRPDHYHGNREMQNSHRPSHDPEKLLSSLGREAQLALTTAIINSVLKTDGREGRSNYRDREFQSRHRGSHHGGRGGYFRDETRERRHFGDDRRTHDSRMYHEEGKDHHYDREKAGPGSRYRNSRYPANRRRPSSPYGHPGPSRKRQRMDRLDDIEGDSSPFRDMDFDDDDKSDLERDRSSQRSLRSTSPERERKGREKREKEEGKSGEENAEGSDAPGGVQVTIGADGERAVNNEGRGRPRVAGRLFVELKCPHCPGQRSITFKEYKYHLGGVEHKGQLSRLARKHSVVLGKIRMQQRQEQKDIELKWKDDKAEEYESAVTRFCNTCKLAFKCLGGDISEGTNLHNSSKLHRMQKYYLHPRCSICRITFTSRMVYEYHIASISHLRVRTATLERGEGDHQDDEQKLEEEEEDDDLDFANFMTVDAVGDDEMGSENEEITGGLDEAEVAKEAETSTKKSRSSKFQDDDEVSLEADWDEDDLEEEDDQEESEAVGTDYVNRIEAYFCSLCSRIIRADKSLGSRTVQVHCRSYNHVRRYRDAHPPIVSSGGEEKADSKKSGQDEENLDEVENESLEDYDQDRLWEEVDESLDALQDEILPDLEESCNLTEEKSTKKAVKEKEETTATESNSNGKKSKLDEVAEESEEEEAESSKEDKIKVDKNRKDTETSSDLLEDIADDSDEDT